MKNAGGLPIDRIERILADPKKNQVLVTGLDRFGISAALAMHQLGAEVIATDPAPAVKGLEPMIDAGILPKLGQERIDLIRESNLVVLSPSLRMGTLASPVVMESIRLGIPLVGELELAHRLLNHGRGLSIMAVTGSRGKSTTAALCAHLLRLGGQKVFLGGDQRRPFSDLFVSKETVDWAVLEVSSFQLEHLSGDTVFIPKIGVWLNLFPDHVDRHMTLRNCGRVKRRMFQGMSHEQTGVFWLDDSSVNQFHEGLACNISGVSRNPARVPLVGALLVRRTITPNGWDHPINLNNDLLADNQNAENAACAACAAMAAGLDENTIQSGLDSFQ